MKGMAGPHRLAPCTVSTPQSDLPMITLPGSVIEIGSTLRSTDCATSCLLHNHHPPVYSTHCLMESWAFIISNSCLLSLSPLSLLAQTFPSSRSHQWPKIEFRSSTLPFNEYLDWFRWLIIDHYKSYISVPFDTIVSKTHFCCQLCI